MLRSLRTITRKYSTNQDIVIKTLNHNLLISKLKCNNLSKCNCVNFVKNLEIKDLDGKLSIWMPILYSDKKWCPLGPPDPLGEITQEEEEEALRREIMQRDNEIYKIHDDEEDEWASSEMEELLIRAA